MKWITPLSKAMWDNESWDFIPTHTETVPMMDVSGIAVGRRLAWGPVGHARFIEQSPKSLGAPMDPAISRPRDAGHAPSATVHYVPCQLTYTHSRAGRFSHLREDASDAR